MNKGNKINKKHIPYHNKLHEIYSKTKAEDIMKMINDDFDQVQTSRGKSQRKTVSQFLFLNWKVLILKIRLYS